MGYRDDTTECLRCEVSATTEHSRAAVLRAAATLGKHVDIAECADGGIMIHILPGMSRTLSQRSPNVRVDVTRTGDFVAVSTQILSYVTSQYKFFGFIPSGPKSVVGRSQHRRFLDSLEAELVALDGRAVPSRGSAHQRASRMEVL